MPSIYLKPLQSIPYCASELPEPKKAFRGCWCPAELFDLMENKTINRTEFALLLLIDSFVQTSGADCYASLEYLGRRIGVKDKTAVSKMVARLKRDGMLIETKFDGRTRHMHAFWSRPKLSQKAGQKAPI